MSNIYENEKVVALKVLLEERGLKKSGNKADLIQRLVEYDQAHEEDVSSSSSDDNDTTSTAIISPAKVDFDDTESTVFPPYGFSGTQINSIQALREKTYIENKFVNIATTTLVDKPTKKQHVNNKFRIVSDDKEQLATLVAWLVENPDEVDEETPVAKKEVKKTTKKDTKKVFYIDGYDEKKLAMLKKKLSSVEDEEDKFVNVLSRRIVTRSKANEKKWTFCTKTKMAFLVMADDKHKKLVKDVNKMLSAQ
uniref:SAP domain-containing protein n=1 Tax=viral metagenome TaxID=1070528 RepID=A0A6C0JRF4_9ZZZZ